MKYKKWLDVWLENYVKQSVKRRTYLRYKEIANDHIKGGLGETETGRITPLLLQTFAATLTESGNVITGRGLSANSVNAILSVVKSSLKAAYISGETKKYAGGNVKRPMPREKNVTCFTFNEQKKIEAAVSAKKGKAFGITLCLYTGLRLGELLSLTWQDIDFKSGVLTVNKTCYDGKDEIGVFSRITSAPKTASSNREIPLPAGILNMLRQHKKSARDEYVISGGKKPVYVRSYQRSFELLLKKLKISRKGFHALRHTFATRALESGMDVKTLSEILGHKNPSVTLTRYVHSMLDHKKAMMNRLGKLL